MALGFATSHPRLIALLAAGIALLLGVLLAGQPSCVLRQRVERWLAPDAVTMKECFEAKSEGPSFDHSLWTAVLQRHVDERGLVDYASLGEDPARLDAYIDRVGEADFDALGRDEKLALLINAYNAFTLRLILDHDPVESIRDIPSDRRWEGRTWRIGDNRWTLHQLEHEVIRPCFVEPRIHFALNCAAWSCPPLPREAFTGEDVDAQLARKPSDVTGTRGCFGCTKPSGGSSCPGSTSGIAVISRRLPRPRSRSPPRITESCKA